MSVLVGKPAPEFKTQAVMPDGSFKEISLADYRGKQHVLRFFYPLDFTFVCPTEIIAFSERVEEFKKRGVEVLSCSVDSKFSHLAWRNVPRTDGGIGTIQYAMLEDMPKRTSSRRSIASSSVAFQQEDARPAASTPDGRFFPQVRKPSGQPDPVTPGAKRPSGPPGSGLASAGATPAVPGRMPPPEIRMLMSLPTSWPAPGRRLRLALSAPVIVATALACSPREAALLIRDVAVVDPASGVVRPGWDIATRGRVIVAVGPDLHPERNAVVVDGRGMYAIPGLWDVHVHLAGLDPLPRAPEQLVASGITSVRDMGGRTGELLRLRADIRSGSRVGPAIVAAGPTLNGAAHADFHRVVATPADATGAVQEIRAAGFDFVKVHNALAPETFFAICDAAKAAGLTVAGHVPHGVTTQEASERGLASLEHVEVLMETEIYRRDHPAPGIGEALATLDGPEGRALFDTMRRNGTAFTPTLAAYRAFVEGQDTAQGRAMGERLYSHLAQLVPQAHAAGVLILAGTDSRSNVGGSLHRELALLVAAGLAPLEALRAATVNPSTFLGRADRARLERGSEATLVLLAANPLDDISNTARIAGVVLAGRYLDPADLRRLHVGN